ncbi:MAG: helix-turn-helix transcriptional regulator [Rickettsiaceae bacterium]|nr:helix-turn-helix transcriptional regulator [Rickettsiaceae bacterium]
MSECSKLQDKEKIFTEHLQDLAGIKLTMREIDIISCILHNRGEKKIASLLDISYRTVSSHVRNIMNKFACNSRDHIIDAIEKSGRLKYLRQYYFYLVMQGSFIKKLKTIGATINRAGILYSVNYVKPTREEEKYLKQIEQHLTLANINLSSNTKGSNKDVCNLFIIRDAENLVDNNAQNIGLLLDDNVNQERLLGLEYIDFRNVENYYLAILLLVNKIVESSEIEKIISEFKIEQESLCSSLKVTDINISDEKPSAKKYINKKPLHYLHP